MHEIVKCKHGTVVRQCRCPIKWPKIERIVECPANCPERVR